MWAARLLFLLVRTGATHPCRLALSRTKAKAGALLGLCARQVHRLCVRYAEHGPAGPASLLTRGARHALIADMVSLVFALLAATQPPDALAGCHAVQRQDLRWEYECAGLLATTDDLSVLPEAGTAWDEAFMLRTLSYEARTPGYPKRSIGKLRVGDREIEVIHFEKDERGGSIAVIDRAEGRRRFFCRGTVARCDAVLAVLAPLPWKGGPPAPIPREVGPRVPLFREVPEAPNGCDEVDVGDGAGFLCRADAADASWSGAFWFTYPSEAPLRYSLTRNVPMLGSLQSQPRATIEKLPCRLNGTATTCTRVLSEKDGRPMFAIHALVRRGDEYVIALCTGPGNKARIPACTALFEDLP